MGSNKNKWHKETPEQKLERLRKGSMVVPKRDIGQVISNEKTTNGKPVAPYIIPMQYALNRRDRRKALHIKMREK